MNLRVFANEDFGQVRVIEIDGEPWFVGKDVAVALGYQNASKALSDHVDDEDKKPDITIRYPSSNGVVQNRNMTVINESGMYSLILSSKLPEAKRFKRWVTSEVLPSIRKTGSYSISQKTANMTPKEAISQVTDIADMIQEKFFVHSGIALAKAISIVEPFYGNSLEPLREILPPAEHETGYLNPTQIGQRLGGFRPQIVNKMLAISGLQYKSGKSWRLTERGANYGEEIPFTRNGHSDYQIRWNEKVLSVLN